ncbi:MAG: hypothetical protein M3Q36_03535 [bacterium]|nr:hypothetical protein [bacterium]
MSWLILLMIVVLGLFSFVLLYGAPYLPTLKSQQEEALLLLNLKPGQTMVELGSGDGRMLVAAAKKGINSIGYELNPLLAFYSWVITRRYHKLITIKWANFWNQPLPLCDGIYVFLLDRFMARLDKKISIEVKSPLKVVSYAFRVPNKKPIREKSGMFMYQYSPKYPK